MLALLLLVPMTSTLAIVDLTSMVEIDHEPECFDVSDERQMVVEGQKLAVSAALPVARWMSVELGGEMTDRGPRETQHQWMAATGVVVESGGLFASITRAWEEPLAMRLDSAAGFRGDHLEVAVEVESLLDNDSKLTVTATVQF